MYLIPLLTGCIPTDGSADALEKARQEGYEQALEEFEGRLNAVKSDLEGQIADVGAAAAAQSDLGGRVTDLETQMAVVQTDLPTLQNDVAALQSSAVTMIEQNVTYSVSTPAAFMQTLADLDHYQIAKDATVTIQLRDGTYYLTETVQIRHPDGDRIRIQGNAGDKSKVKLVYTGTAGSYAVQVVAGSRLAYLGDLSISCNTNGYGLQVDPNGSVNIGEMKIEGCERGISVVAGSLTAADGVATARWLEVVGCYDGVFGKASSWLDLPYAEVSSSSHFGYVSDWGTIMRVSYSTAESNAAAGYYASNSTIFADNTISVGNGAQGYIADYLSMIAAPISESSTNNVGYWSDRNSYIQATPTNAYSNIVDYAAYANSFIDVADPTGTFSTASGFNDTTDWILTY